MVSSRCELSSCTDLCTVVTIQFQQPQFTGTEQSRLLGATVVLSGGTVSFPFAVTVTPSSGTATGVKLLEL